MTNIDPETVYGLIGTQPTMKYRIWAIRTVPYS
jgi:hypothetical protein